MRRLPAAVLAVAEGGPVRVRVFDALGREVARLASAQVEGGRLRSRFEPEA